MRRILRKSFIAGLALVALPGISPAAGTGLEGKFDKGVKFESEDGSFKLKFGGRVQADFAFFDADQNLEAFLGETFEDGSEFRRLRLEVEGQIYDVVLYKAQYDFAGSEVAAKDVYIGLKLSTGKVLVGHFKEPFSLEELTSSKYITFLERSLANVLAPSRNTGIGYFGDFLDERMTFALSVTQDADDSGDSTCGDANVTARVTGLPFENENGLLHIGAGATHRDPCDGLLRVRQRPDAHNAPRIVDTGTIGDPADGFLDGVDSWQAYNLEVAGVFGSFGFQTEAITGEADSDDPSIDGATLEGHYLEASYFLTGESRNYKKKDAAFDKVTPKENFSPDGGLGAIELALRYASLDLSDQAFAGGEVDAITGGVNWYLNPNTRVMLNLTQAERDNEPGLTDGKVTIGQVRFQVFW